MIKIIIVVVVLVLLLEIPLIKNRIKELDFKFKSNKKWKREKDESDEGQ
jgi:predicted Holliday junction resolvase-like endonuclease